MHSWPRLRRALAATAMLALVPFCANAADYYLHPTAGNNANSGTRASPLSSLESVAASGRVFSSGDVLILLAGYHGFPTLRSANTGEVIVRPDDGATVTIRRLTFQASSNWTVRGLDISPANTTTFERATIVTISGGSNNIVEGCSIYTTPDSSGWSATDWDTRSCNGIAITGTQNTARNNVVLNVNFGITVSGTYCLVQGNTVNRFCGDGLRGLGDYCTFEYNVVKNAYNVNSNHADGFQSYSQGAGGVGTGVVRGVVLRGNTFINFEDPNQPFKATLQAIGCFDGFFEDWVVENNLVVADDWHGITLMGARNCRIVNNTVVDNNSASPGPPWIRIAAHKDGTPSTGNLIRNNLATDFSSDAGAATTDHNLEIPSYASYGTYFVDPANFDFRLRAGSPAIDAGTSESAPGLDLAGSTRPADGNADGTAAWDVGAYEYGAGSGGNTVTAPTFTPGSTSSLTAIQVTLACSTSGAAIHYTIDGSEPTTGSTAYSSPLTISVTTTIRARAFKSGSTASAITSATYSIGALTSTTGWTNAAFTAQTGTFTASFTLTPSAAGINAITGLSFGAADAYTDLAIILRFGTTGVIDARNGAAYAAVNTLSYTAGTNYLVSLTVDVPNHRYSATITPTGGAAVVIAQDYAFRTEQASVTSLNQLSVVAEAGSHTLTGFTLGAPGTAPAVPSGLGLAPDL